MQNIKKRNAFSQPEFWITRFIVLIGFSFITSTQIDIFAQAVTQGNGESERRSKIVISAKDEPGERMIVTGTVYQSDGKTPVVGITVYVYHTDAEGYYRKGANSSRNPRLKGTMVTDEQGRYEYRTIKPGAYPGGGNPAHVHYVLSGEGFEKQYDELMFEGDPHLSRRKRHLSDKEKANTFMQVRPLVKDEDGVWKCVKDVRLKSVSSG